MLNKKLFLILMLCLFYFNVFAFDVYDYLYKKVKITTIFNEEYTGIVQEIFRFGICDEYDIWGNCREEKIYYSVYLKQEKEIIQIKESLIYDIEELE